MSTAETKPKEGEKRIPESTLPVGSDGKIYHLSIRNDEIAPNIIIVGDPERVPIISKKKLSVIRADAYHRGLRTITGDHITKEGRVVPMSIVTSGMGEPSLEIVFGELAALREIDLATRTPKDKCGPPFTIIRVGTSGALRTGTALGTCVVAKYSIGLDNTGHYYDVPASPAVKAIEERATKAVRSHARPGARFASKLTPYVSAAHPDVVAALETAGKSVGCPYVVGVTVSAAGFFCNQGRQILESILPTVPNVDDVMGSIDLSGIDDSKTPINVENMEMETSLLFHLGKSFGYRCGSVCCTIAQRRAGTFLGNHSQAVEDAFSMAVEALCALHEDK